MGKMPDSSKDFQNAVVTNHTWFIFPSLRPGIGFQGQRQEAKV